MMGPFLLKFWGLGGNAGLLSTHGWNQDQLGLNLYREHYALAPTFNHIYVGTGRRVYPPWIEHRGLAGEYGVRIFGWTQKSAYCSTAAPVWAETWMLVVAVEKKINAFHSGA